MNPFTACNPLAMLICEKTISPIYSNCTKKTRQSCHFSLERSFDRGIIAFWLPNYRSVRIKTYIFPALITFGIASPITPQIHVNQDKAVLFYANQSTASTFENFTSKMITLLHFHISPQYPKGNSASHPPLPEG